MFRRKYCLGLAAMAFGAGLILAALLFPIFVSFLLAAAVIFVGLRLLRCC